jgi:hypothetical protein
MLSLERKARRRDASLRDEDLGKQSRIWMWEHLMTQNDQLTVIPCAQLLDDITTRIRPYLAFHDSWRKLPPSSTPSSTRISAFGAASGGKKEWMGVYCLAR